MTTVAAMLRCEQVTAARPGQPARISGVLPIRPDTPYQEGHFPGRPIFPGVFVLEAVRQLVRQALGVPGAAPELRLLRSVRLTAPVFPGDRLVVDAGLSWPAGASEVDVTARCGCPDGRRVATVDARLGWP